MDDIDQTHLEACSAGLEAQAAILARVGGPAKGGYPDSLGDLYHRAAAALQAAAATLRGAEAPEPIPAGALIVPARSGLESVLRIVPLGDEARGRVARARDYLAQCEGPPP